MKNKVIFLDVDGVLNSEHWYIKNHKRHPEKCRPGIAINPRFVKNLRRIVQATGAQIVLSATCRGTVKRNKTHYLHTVLKEYGLEISGYTPHTGMERGIDIQEWLNSNPYVDHIVILDDNSDMRPLMDYLVQTKSFVKIPFLWLFTEGLSYFKAKQAIKILNRPFVNKCIKNIRRSF